MARTRQSITSGTTENNIYFYPAGGHSHDGQNSTLIDATKYSIYDFNFNFVGDNPERRRFQSNSYSSMQQLIKDTVTTFVLEPAGLVLQPNTLNGASIIARTITANLIAANTITANELAANIILVNNTIKSNTYDSGIGWAIYSNGFADFENVRVIGNVTANTGSIGGWTLASDAIYVGTKTASGSYTASTGHMTIGSDGHISANKFRINSDGSLYATSANISGTITGSSISGSTITGGTIQTATSGRRVLLDTNGIRVYKSNGAEAFSLYGTDQVYADSLVLHNGYPSGPVRLWSTIGDGATITRILGVTNQSTGSNGVLIDGDNATIDIFGSANYRYSYASNNSALPWHEGPSIRGYNGWSYYGAASGAYEMGHRHHVAGGEIYAWIRGGLLVGSQPNDSLALKATITVTGSGAFSSIPSSTNLDGTWQDVGGGYYKLAYQPWSTRKVKTDIAPVGEELDPNKLLDLEVVQFKYKEGYISEGDPIENVTICGLIAEDVLQHYPTIVRLDRETWEPQSINYNLIIPPLLGLVQNLEKRIKVLENKE